MRRRILLLSLLCAGLIQAPAYADYKSELLKPGTIVVGTTASAPPWTLIDRSGQIAGYDIDVIRKVGEGLGLKVELVQLDWAGLLPGLAARRFDVVASGVARTAERRASKDFIMSSPHGINGIAVLKAAADASIKDWGDLCGKRMGEVRGAVWGKFARETLAANCVSNVREYPGEVELMLDIKARRIDWGAMGSTGAFFIAKNDPALATLAEVRNPQSVGVAINGKSPELAKAISAELDKLRANGTLSEIGSKNYGLMYDWSKLPAD